jgi:hypothetical protein
MRDLSPGVLCEAGSFFVKLLWVRDVSQSSALTFCSHDFILVYIINDVRDSLLAHAVVNYA